jgi:ubiquinone/menaquinone biosynthesis C-methylase UbiE
METYKIRDEALPYCMGNGLDLGYGGDKITKSAISIDLNRYDDLNYQGDARELPFKAGTMDYVYSSHLLEEFDNPATILAEWVRVLKVGGYLILYLPIQQKYVEYCAATNQPTNPGHKTDMSLKFLLYCIGDLPVEIVKLIDHHADYSFFIVFRVKGD